MFFYCNCRQLLLVVNSFKFDHFHAKKYIDINLFSPEFQSWQDVKASENQFRPQNTKTPH